MSNINRVPVAEWRRQYYATKKGIPSVAAIKKSIDTNEVPGKAIAGVYHVNCDHRYEPLWHLLEKTPPKPAVKVSSAIAERILQQEGLA